MIKRITIGTRGSDLALAQTRQVASLLRARLPQLDVVERVFSTRGDRELDKPLPTIGGKGLFTAELEAALLDGRIDLAVHSLKDLPTESPAGLCVGAIPPRASAFDAIISRRGEDLAGLARGARVGTSSLRRRAQLLACRPDLVVIDLRGNVPTRVRKVREGELDAVVVAMAGLDRLGLAAEASQVLAAQQMLPAAGQGALAVQARQGNEELPQILCQINDVVTERCVAVERACLAALDGGCHLPLGILATPDGDKLVAEGCLCSPDGEVVIRATRKGAPGDAERVGMALADDLMAQGGRMVLDGLA